MKLSELSTLQIDIVKLIKTVINLYTILYTIKIVRKQLFIQ